MMCQVPKTNCKNASKKTKKIKLDSNEKVFFIRQNIQPLYFMLMHVSLKTSYNM